MFTDPFKLRVELYALHLCASQFTFMGQAPSGLPGHPPGEFGSVGSLSA